MAKRKSILDNILSGIGQTGSNIASSVSKLSTPTVKSASTFADNFVKGFQSFSQEQEKRAQESRQVTQDFTSGLLKTTQQKASTLADIYNKTQKPNLIGFNSAGLETPDSFKKIKNVVAKTLPATFEGAKANIKSGAGNLLSNTKKTIEDMPLQIPDPTDIILRTAGIDKNKLLPEWAGGQKATIGQVTDKLNPKIRKNIDKPIQGLLDSAQKDSKKSQELAQTVDVGETGDWTKDLLNPEYIAKSLTLNVPSFATGILTTAAVTFLTKNPIVGLSSGFGTSYVQNAGDVYLEAKQNGADEQTARQVSNGVGIINAGLDTLGIGKVLNLIPGGKQARGQLVTQILKRVGESMFAEGSTESLQQLIQNVTAKFYYDHQRDIFAGIPQSAFFGAIMGGAGSVLSFGDLQNTQEPTGDISTQAPGLPTPPQGEISPLNQANPGLFDTGTTTGISLQYYPYKFKQTSLPGYSETGLARGIYKDGKVVGGVDFFQDGSEPNKFWINNIEITANAQKQGIGKEAISQVFNQTKAEILSGYADEASVGFWKKLGAKVDANNMFTLSRENFQANPNDAQFRMAPPTSADVVRIGPVLNTKQDINGKDIHGNTFTIPQGDALTPYELKDNRVLLKDGGEYIVSKNQYENVKGQSIKAEAQPFAPELAQTEETVRGNTMTSEDSLILNEVLERNDLLGFDNNAEARQALRTNPPENWDLNPQDLQIVKDINKKRENRTKYSNYTLPGGENYREVLIKAPLRHKSIDAKKAFRIRKVEPNEVNGLNPLYEGDNAPYYQVWRESDDYAIYSTEDIGDAKNYLKNQQDSTSGNPYSTAEVDFKSSHWDEPNVISHLRLNERTYQGKKVTFMEELQSDWAREGRTKGFQKSDDVALAEKQFQEASKKWEDFRNKGWDNYEKTGKDPVPAMVDEGNRLRINRDTAESLLNRVKNETTPNHPLLNKWQELSIKRGLKDAVDNNSEYFSWINGEQTSARYNLATYLDDVNWQKGTNGKNIMLNTKDGKRLKLVIGDDGVILYSELDGAKGKKLDEAFGKGLADKIMGEESGKLSGEGLKFGGEWAENLYDKQVKNIVEDLTGGKVEVIDLGLPIVKESNISWNVGDSSARYAGANHLDMAKYKNLKVGDIISQGPNAFSEWVVTDVLGDGKFEATPRTEWNKKIRTTPSEVFDISQKTTTQQAIKLTPEIRAKILGQAPQVKQPSGVSPFDNKSDVPQYSAGDTSQLSDSASLIQKDLQQMLNEDISKQPETTPENFDKTVKEAEDIIASFFTPEEIEFKTQGEPIVTPEGIMAQGVYYKALINVLEQNGKVESKTVYHEAFHAYADKFANPELYGSALYEIMSKDGITKQAAAEKLAEGFADYVSGKQTFTGQVLSFFQDFINKFRSLIGKDNSAQMMYDAIVNKERPMPAAQDGIQAGITSAQPMSPVTAELLAKGQELFNTGNIDEGLTMLQEVTKSTQQEFEGLLFKHGVDMKRLETNTHGLYFGIPEPSYFAVASKDSEVSFVQALAEFAKNHKQESFITAQIGEGPLATPGLTLNFGKDLSNQQVLQIEEIANNKGIGLTLNQRTGEAVSYNVNEFDGMTRAEWENAAVAIVDELAQNGFNFKKRLDNYTVKVYNSNQYDTIINSNNKSEVGARGDIAGTVEGGQYPSNTPQYRAEQFTGPRGTELQTTTPEVARVRRLPNADIKTAGQIYNQTFGYPPIKENIYIPVNEQVNKSVADAYDALPKIDNSPETQRAYTALGNEIQRQWDFATQELGMKLEPWTQEGQPYQNSQEMVSDVRDNKHLYFFTGGETHPVFNQVDASGININDKFRAIHDLFGHASEGYGFGPRGEENAWIKHSQMFSPEAQAALTTETRGQSSWVNFGPQNYDAEGNYLNIPPQNRPYAEQKVALLPPEFRDWKQAMSSDQTLFAQTPQYRVNHPELPSGLRNAKPRYKTSELQFTSDIDKAIYIVGNPEKLSANDAEYMSFLKGIYPNKTVSEIRSMSKEVKNRIKTAEAQTPEGEPIIVSSVPVVKEAEVVTPASVVSESGKFVPSEEWQEYNSDQAVPIGGEFKTENGKQYVRFPKEIAQQNEDTIKQDQGAQVAGQQAYTGSIPLDATNIVPPVPPIEPESEGPKLFEKKPGQINVNNLDLTDAQKQHVLDVAKTMDYESLTNDEIKKIAEYVGVDTKGLNKQQQAVQIAKKFNTRRRVVELEKQADALKAKGAPVEEIQAKELEIANAREKVEAQKSLEGRALQANKILADEFNTPRQRVYALLEEAGVKPEDYTKAAATIDFNNSDQVVNMYRSLVPAKWHDWIDKIRYGSMLSSVNTNIINLASNFQGTGLISPIDLTIQGALDKAANVLSGGKYKRTRFAGEGIEYAKGFYGAQFNSLKNALHTFWEPIWDQGKEIDTRFIPLTKKGSKMRIVENVVDAPGRLLSVEDKYALSAAQAGYLRALQYRQDNGIKVNNIIETATDKGKKAIFTSPAYNPGEGAVSDAVGYIAGRLQELTNAKPGLVRWPAKFTMPFIRIGTNIFKRGLEYTPAGLINLKGNTDKIEQLSHVLMGSVVAYGAFKLAAAGLLQGGYDEDKTKRDQQKAAGVLDWSIKMNGSDGKTHYMQFSKMHPLFGFQLGFYAALFQGVEEGKLNEDKAAVALDVLAKVTQYTNDQTYWRNIGDFVDVMGGDPYAITNLIGNYPSQVIPFRAMGSWITRAIDEYQRASDPDADIITKLVQRIQGGIPLLSTGVPTKKGPYGEDLKHPDRLSNLVAPYKTSTADPIGLQLYEQMKERAYINKVLDKESEATKKIKEGIIKLSPEELKTKKGQDLQKEIDRGLLKLGAAPGSKNNIYMFIDPNNSTEVKTIDLNQFEKEATGIGKFKQQEEKYSTAREIFESPLTDEEKASAYKTLKLEADDVEYDYYSSQTNELKYQYLSDFFQDKSHDDILKVLTSGRINSISGNILASDGVISLMEDEGLISKDEAKALKAIKYNKKGDLLSTGGSGKKAFLSLTSGANKVDTSPAKGTSAQFKSAMGSDSGNASNLIYKRINAKLPISAGSSSNSGAKLSLEAPTPKIRTMVRNISGLGQL